MVRKGEKAMISVNSANLGIETRRDCRYNPAFKFERDLDRYR